MLFSARSICRQLIQPGRNYLSFQQHSFLLLLPMSTSTSTSNAIPTSDTKETDHDDIRDLIHNLQSDCLVKKRRKKWFRSVLFSAGEKVLFPLRSWSCPDYLYVKAAESLPTSIRGLFIYDPTDLHSNPTLFPQSTAYAPYAHQLDSPKLIIRGYDKFFNLGEIPSHSWEQLAQTTQGPYEVTVKENGCIIFLSAFCDQLVLTSKHAMANEHAEMGLVWLNRTLDKTADGNPMMLAGLRLELIDFLQKNNMTAVFELADDQFEEHVLPYSKEKSGLYVHGLNYNSLTFKSAPFEEVKAFAERFGFFVVQSEVRNTIDDVRMLTDDVRSCKSHYQGRPVEGFVIRCKRVSTGDNSFFFKVKYNEPYLLYREWREVTKSLLSGKKFQPRFPETELYVTWVKKAIKDSPHLFTGFNKNRGIIKVRELFQEETNQPITGTLPKSKIVDGKETIESQMEQLSIDDVSSTKKVILVPVATIGSGKTVLGGVLQQLFGFVHIQNDNITKKKKGKGSSCSPFTEAVLKALETSDLVYADRNNHMRSLRQELLQSIKNIYPNAQVIALDWEIVSGKENEIIKLTAERIEKRGENHQSLTPQRSANYKQVIRNFVRIRDPIDLEAEGDQLIDHVIPMNIFKTVEEGISSLLERLVPLLQKSNVQKATIPKQSQICKALKAALSQKVEVIKNVKSQWRYIGISIHQSIKDALESIMSQHGSTTPPAIQEMYQTLLNNNRINTHHHLTLIHCSRKGDTSAASSPGNDNNSSGNQIWKELSQRLRVQEKLPTEKHTLYDLSLDEIWSTDKVMFFKVSRICTRGESGEEETTQCSLPFPILNTQLLHVTIGTISDEVAAKTSLDTLTLHQKNEAIPNLTRWTLPTPVLVQGHLQGFL